MLYAPYSNAVGTTSTEWEELYIRQKGWMYIKYTSVCELIRGKVPQEDRVEYEMFKKGKKTLGSPLGYHTIADLVCEQQDKNLILNVTEKEMEVKVHAATLYIAKWFSTENIYIADSGKIVNPIDEMERLQYNDRMSEKWHPFTVPKIKDTGVYDDDQFTKMFLVFAGDTPVNFDDHMKQIFKNNQLLSTNRDISVYKRRGEHETWKDEEDIAFEIKYSGVEPRLENQSIDVTLCRRLLKRFGIVISETAT